MSKYVVKIRKPIMHLISAESSCGTAEWVLTVCGLTIDANRAKLSERKMKYPLCKKCLKFRKERT